MAALTEATRMGMQMRFQVTVDDLVDLGGWTSCAGLSVGFEPEMVKEGGNYEYDLVLSGRLKYEDITLKRAMVHDDSAKVQTWLASRVDNWINADGRPSGCGLKISLQDAYHGEVASWSFRNAFPRKWTGPELDANGGKVAIETLVLVHEGFL